MGIKAIANPIVAWRPMLPVLNAYGRRLVGMYNPRPTALQ